MYPTLYGQGQGQGQDRDHGSEPLPSIYSPSSPPTFSYSRPTHSAITIGASLSSSPASMRVSYGAGSGVASRGHSAAESGGLPSLPNFSSLSAKANLGKAEPYRRDTSLYANSPSPLASRKCPAGPVAVGPALHSPASVGRERLSSPPSSPLTPPAAVSMVGAYMVDKTLGQGSYGKVKLGIHQETREKVALKFIHKSSIKKETHLIRIRREVRLLRLLSHPHIIKLLHVIETDADIILVMEHAPGGELLDYVQARGKLTEAQARPLFRQIISSVAYIHRHCIIHRDLKPQNLLLDATRSNIKLVDFGFANTFEPKGLLGTFCGSPYYAAPEMVSGTKYTGPEVDVWSLGVILYSMLTGTVPFNDENVKGLYAKILAGHYEMPSELSMSAKDLIQSMMVVDRRARPSVESLMNHVWVTEGMPKLELRSPSVSASFVPLDERVLNKLRDYQIDPITAQNQIMRDPNGRAASIYSLLSDKMRMDETQNSSRKRQLSSYDSLSRQLTSEMHGRLSGGSNASKVRKAGYHPATSSGPMTPANGGSGFMIPDRILSEDETESLADVGTWTAHSTFPSSPLSMAGSPVALGGGLSPAAAAAAAVDFYYQPTMNVFNDSRHVAKPVTLFNTPSDKSSLSESSPVVKSGFPWFFKFGKNGRDKQKIHPSK